MSGDAARPVRILLVDDHPFARSRVRQIIEAASGLSVCGEADSRESALQAVRAADVDLVIVDVTLGPVTSLDVVHELRNVDPGLPILVLSIEDALTFTEEALRAGACGFLQKQQASEHLADAVREVMAGRLYVSQRVMQAILRTIAGGPRA